MEDEGAAGTNRIDDYLGSVGFQPDWGKLKRVCRAISKIVTECCEKAQQDNGLWIISRKTFTLRKTTSHTEML